MVRGKRGSDVGFDVIEAPLPAIASVTQTAHEPRYPTLPNIMKAKKKEIAHLDAGRYRRGRRVRSAWARRAPPSPAPSARKPSARPRSSKPASGEEAAK